MKIICAYQTGDGTRIEYEDGAWAVDLPLTYVMERATGKVYLFASESRGDRVAKKAFQCWGEELREVPAQEFPEPDYIELIGYVCGLVNESLGGMERIWETFEAALYPA